ncbi:MAG: hypothetical protein JWO22_1754 [Frankiales bacterium]|nr:hypothetical protein [Frankiales bacterium]
MRAREHDRDEGGFTLIELLVVIIIIGILSAIAIPIFLRQRQRAYEASLKSDLRTVANELESYQSDDLGYPLQFDGATLTGSSVIGSGVARLSINNSVDVTFNAAASGYCLKAYNPRGGTDWYYISTLGGLMPRSTAACGSF